MYQFPDPLKSRTLGREERIRRVNAIYPEPKTIEEKVERYLSIRGGDPVEVRARYLEAERQELIRQNLKDRSEEE